MDQDPLFHPEGDALYHSLQVFGCALEQTWEPALLAAALFHDVGKADGDPGHAPLGGELLAGLLPDRACWLVAHHMDLLVSPRRTRRRRRGDPRLGDLVKLRRWDMGGRDPYASVLPPEEAVALVVKACEAAGAQPGRGDAQE